MAQLAVEVGVFENFLELLKRPICPCGLLRPFHRAAVEEYEGDLVDVNLIRNRQLPYGVKANEIALFVGDDLILALHDLVRGNLILFEGFDSHIHTVAHPVFDRRNIFGRQQLLELLIVSYKSVEIIAK